LPCGSVNLGILHSFPQISRLACGLKKVKKESQEILRYSYDICEKGKQSNEPRKIRKKTCQKWKK
jgi:hypothetical protein